MDYVNQYFNEINNSGKSRNTIYSYMAPVRQFKEWLVGSTGEFAPEYWTEEWVIDFLAWLGRTKSEVTVRLFTERLRLFFKWAVDQGLIKHYIIEEKISKPAKPFDGKYVTWLTGKSKNTVKTYDTHIRHFAEWLEGRTGESFSPDKITPTDINAYLRYLKDETKRPATINGIMFAIRSYLNFVVDTGLIKENPFRWLNGVTQQLEAKKTRWLDNNQQYNYMRRVESQTDKRGYMDKAVVLSMLDAGLRASEVCNLRLEQVILYPVKEARIEVLHSKWNRSHSVPIASTTKGEGKRLHKALKVYLEEREKKRGKAQPWFFLSSRGEKLTPKVIQKIVAHYRENGESITPHTLRHTFGHNLVQGGMMLHEVAELMGHMRADGSPNVQTVTIYTMSSEWEKRKKMDDILL